MKGATMAASSSSVDHHDEGHRRSHHRRHLNVDVPAVAHNGFFSGCFRPSPTSSSSPAGNAHAERPASPSLIRSPTAWIRARGHSFASSARHARRRSGDFHYDARSYARNFDEGTDGEASGDEAGLAAGDTLKHRCFSARLPVSPPPAPSPSAPSPFAVPCDGGKGKDNVPAREKGRDME
ncbi:hypothetical protein GUJ93_ZPchr0012g18828 [Zizania palustris]|uniref:Uncharacterized protein n=1 Tax=Zizania palustris TaxID=103762 RepID=A0A8J5WJE8_ZIZPA|nr:hypothetical protein GUJ93_ZPchr0012g18828 [Zizania palustris]